MHTHTHLVTICFFCRAVHLQRDVQQAPVERDVSLPSRGYVYEGCTRACMHTFFTFWYPVGVVPVSCLYWDLWDLVGVVPVSCLYWDLWDLKQVSLPRLGENTPGNFCSKAFSDFTRVGKIKKCY